MRITLFGNMSLSQVLFSLLVFALSIDFCQAGIYRYRKSTEDESGHKLRHPSRSTSGYNHNCFFTPMNCLKFLNAEPGLIPSSITDQDVKVVEYHVTDDKKSASSEQDTNEKRKTRSIARSQRFQRAFKHVHRY